MHSNIFLWLIFLNIIVGSEILTTATLDDYDYIQNNNEFDNSDDYSNFDQVYQESKMEKRSDKSNLKLDELNSNIQIYKKLVSELRNNWKMPTTYLKKRGYLPRSFKDIKDEKNMEKMLDSQKSKEDYEKLTEENLDKIKKTLEGKSLESTQKEFFYFPPVDKFKKRSQLKFSPRSMHLSYQYPSASPGEIVAPIAPTTSTTSTTAPLAPPPRALEENDKKSSFFQSIKEKWNELFQKKSNLDESYDYYSDLTPESDDLINFDYDIGNWLGNNEVNSELEDDSLLYKDSQNELLEKREAVKNSDVFQNLSQTETEFLKNFIKCFKQSKNLFLKDHMSNISNVDNKTATKPETPNDKKIPTPVTVNKNSNDSCSASVNKQNTKPDSPVNINITLSPSEGFSSERNIDKTKEKDTECKKKEINNSIIKFLADLHHNVDQVGKMPHKPLDLKHIQQMIDETRRNYLKPSVILSGGGSGVGGGDNTAKGSKSDNNECPIQVDGMNLEMDWNESLPSEKSLKSRHTKNLQFDLDDKNPYAQIISDSLREYFQKYEPLASSLPNSNFDLNSEQENSKKSNKKRFTNNDNEVEVFSDKILDNDDYYTYQEKSNDKRNVDKNYENIMGKFFSDISDSLKSKDKFSEKEFYADSYDYGSQKPARENENFYDFTDDLDENRIDLIGHGQKKHKKRKKNSKMKDIHPILTEMKNSKDVDENEKHVESSKSTDDKSEDLTFSELGDIKFRVNPNQEEDIQKFIDDLNAPPEIFNFDLKKYLQPKIIDDENIPNKFELENPVPQKTFYEFISTPEIENEKVPYIHPEIFQNSWKNERNSENEENSSNTDKLRRDVLKEYIKGVNSVIKYNHPEDALIRLKDITQRKVQPDVDLVSTRKDVLIDNFADNLDAMNFIKYKKNDENEDDFIDKFYLLNDGISDVGKYDKTEDKTDRNNIPAVYDPTNVNIDLDLDKKFREFQFGRNALNKGTNINNEGDDGVEDENIRKEKEKTFY